MPGISFTVQNAAAVPYAAAPTIAFELRATNPLPDRTIQSIALRCQIMIEASRRRYTTGEKENLRDLFGEPDRWSATLRSLLWTHATTTVPSFTDQIVFELPVPCTFDFNVAASKYFHAVEEVAVPLCFQFSGTVFYNAPNGTLQIEQIGWDKEAKLSLPAGVWREMMDQYYPNSAWLRLSRDAFERLYRYKSRHGLATWEEAIEKLIPLEKEAAL